MALNLTEPEVSTLVGQLLPKMQRQGGEWRGMPCPLHGGDNAESFSVNAKTGAAQCFSAGCKGDLADVAKAVLSLGSIREALDQVEAIVGRAPGGPGVEGGRRSPGPKAKAPTKAPEEPRAPWVPKKTAPMPWPDLRAVPLQEASLLLSPAAAKTLAYLANKRNDAPKAEHGPVTVTSYAEGFGFPLAFAVVRLDGLSPDGSPCKLVQAVAWDGKGWGVKTKDLTEGGTLPAFVPGHGGQVPDGAAVVVVEGEKAALAAAATLPPGFVAVSWHGGGGRTKGATVTQLAGRRVFLAPDNDPAGEGFAQGVASRLGPAAEFFRVSYDPAPEGATVDKGWDVADADPDALRAWWPGALARAGGFEAAQAALEPLWWAIASHEDPLALWRGGKSALTPRLAAGRAEVARLAREAKDEDAPKANREAAAVCLGEATKALEALEACAIGLRPLDEPYFISNGKPHKRGQGRALVIASRPIAPTGLGVDAGGGRRLIQITWEDIDGATRSRWLPVGVANSPRLMDAMAQQEAPINTTNREMGGYLDAAAGKMLNPARTTIATRTGWQDLSPGAEGRLTLVGPGDALLVEVLGEGVVPPATWKPRGSVDAWRACLGHLAGLGEAGFPALAVLGLCAGAPLARLLGSGRNPMLGLAHPTSSGKSSVGLAGMAIWGPPEELTIDRTTRGTSKGLQDKLMVLMGLPIFLDEMGKHHAERAGQMDPDADAVYAVGNGQRRVTSSKDQKAVGGEIWRGVGIAASEGPFAHKMTDGAAMRLIELTCKPLPDAATADLVKATAHANSGALAPSLVQAYNAQGYETLKTKLAQVEAGLASELPSLPEPKRGTVALVVLGLGFLSQAVGLALPVKALGLWLGQQAVEEHETRQDQYEQALQALVSLAMNQDWPPTEDHNGNPIPVGKNGQTLKVGSQVLAWRDSPEVQKFLDLAPEHPDVVNLLRNLGPWESFARAMADRGWIARQDRHLGWKRAGRGRVYRFTPSGVRAVLLEKDDEDSAPLASVLQFLPGHGRQQA